MKGLEEDTGVRANLLIRMEAKVYRFINKLPLPKIKPFLNYMHSKGKIFHLDQSIQAVIEWGQKFFLRALPLEGIRNISFLQK